VLLIEPSCGAVVKTQHVYFVFRRAEKGACADVLLGANLGRPNKAKFDAPTCLKLRGHDRRERIRLTRLELLLRSWRLDKGKRSLGA